MCRALANVSAMDSKKFKELLAESTQVDLALRKELEKKLAREAPRHIGTLAELLGNEAVAVRRGAVEILRRIAAGHEQALSLLLNRLSIEPDVKTRRRLAAAIADSGRSEVSRPLSEQLEKEEHRFVQASLILALGKLRFRDWPGQWLEYLDREGPVAEAMRKAVTQTAADAENLPRPCGSPRRPAGTYILRLYPGLERLVRMELRLHDFGEVSEQAPGWVALPAVADDAFERLGQLRTILADYCLALSASAAAGVDIKAVLEKGTQEILNSAPYLKGGCTFRLSLPAMETRADYRKLVTGLGRHIERISGWLNNPKDYDIDLRLLRFDSKQVIIWRDRRWQSARQNETRQVVPASIHPSVAAALCLVAAETEAHRLMTSGGKVLLDPCCGAGTIMREWLTLFTQARAIGYDISEKAIQLSRQNLDAFQSRCKVGVGDMRRLPLQDSSVDFIVCNLPFGVRVKHESPNRVLYAEFASEAARVLRKGGWLVTYTADRRAITSALQAAGWRDVLPLAKVLAGGLEVTVHRVQKRSHMA